tara:strand:+ start:4650 stop:6554 length:1905 start_codon:yes stop_codon:yes gene_type:complete
LKKLFYCILSLFFFSYSFAIEVNEPNYEFEIPELIVEGVPYEIIISASQKTTNPLEVVVNSENTIEVFFDKNQQASFEMVFDEKGKYTFTINNQSFDTEVNPLPIWLSIIPPLIAILLALVFKEVITSLLIGIFFGAFVVHFYASGFIDGLLLGFMSTIDHYILKALNDSGHLSIVLFSLLIGGMVSLISKNGGMQGVVNRISKYATNAKNGQLATFGLGIAIFFDDYANTLIVGNTMRPITDQLKISRQKLAYIVDSTAAPMAAIALITTWIGAELGYIENGINQIEGLNAGVYATFISSLAYSFYPIFTIAFMFILIYKEKDFGPMYQVEMQARKALKNDFDDETSSAEQEAFQIKKGIQPKAFNAVVPILVVIFGTIAGLLYTGWNQEVVDDKQLGIFQKLSTIIGNSDSYQALLWASLAGLLVAIKLSLLRRILSLQQTIESIISGFKTMLPAIIILVLAWSLAIVIEEMQTAQFLTSALSEYISPHLIPSITFIMAALVAFSTGSSWGTMAILYPIMIPLAWSISIFNGLDPALTMSIFHSTIACVLAGAVLGDHCSPISDTTILSSLASSCNHIEHVKTQIPYALTVGLVAILFGTLPSGFGIPPWIGMIFGIVAMYGIIHFLGKKVS